MRRMHRVHAFLQTPEFISRPQAHHQDPFEGHSAPFLNQHAAWARFLPQTFTCKLEQASAWQTRYLEGVGARNLVRTRISSTELVDDTDINRHHGWMQNSVASLPLQSPGVAESVPLPAAQRQVIGLLRVQHRALDRAHLAGICRYLVVCRGQELQQVLCPALLAEAVLNPDAQLLCDIRRHNLWGHTQGCSPVQGH